MMAAKRNDSVITYPITVTFMVYYNFHLIYFWMTLLAAIMKNIVSAHSLNSNIIESTTDA